MNRKRTLLAYIKRYAPEYLAGLACLMGVDFITLYIPQITGEITDGLTLGTMTGKILLTDALLIILIAAAAAAMRFGWRVGMFGASRKMERDIRMDLYEHLTIQSNRFYQHNKTGDLMAYFTNDMDAIRMAVGPGVLTAFDATAETIMVLVKMILYVDLKLTLLAMLPMLIILFGGLYYGKAMDARYARKQAAFASLSDKVQESLSGIRVVKAFVQEKKELEAFEEANRKTRETNLRVVRLRAFVIPVLDGLIGIASALTLLYGSRLVLNGTISLGKFVAFDTYILTLVWPMMAAGEAITTLSQGAASWKRVRSIFQVKPEITDDELTDTTITELGSDIRFEDLRFRYAEPLPEVFSGLKAEIPAGSTIGILGRTGCGKSTLVSLLSRLEDVEPGQIFVGGHDIRTIPLGVLREHIACVPQENILFSDTLQTNIAFATRTLDRQPPEKEEKYKIFIRQSEAAEQAVELEMAERESRMDREWGDLQAAMDAARAADVHDNIMDFPKQYATVVGERGVTLSGGQKQRTSIARAIMKDAPILILDDALSAVDTDTEERILQALKELRRGKTTILIAHRVSTVQGADRIMVLEDGVCGEYGTHAELMKKGGSYARLFEQQQLELQIAAERQNEREALEHAE